jgi:DNA-3-methyladenine glycosylase II
MAAPAIEQAMAALCAAEPALEAAHRRHGPPEPRIWPRGLATLVRILAGQQLSTTAAAAIWRRLQQLADIDDPRALLGLDAGLLRLAGLSGAKIGYVQALAAAVYEQRLDLDRLPPDDEAAIATLCALPGIGRWSAEIYLLFAEGRSDCFPAGDLAVRVAAGRLLGLDGRPSERDLRLRAEPWRPHRGTAALFFWHCYNGGLA